VLTPGHSLSKDALLDRLWGDADSQAANANFYRTLYHLRRVLEPNAPPSGSSFLVFENGLLRLRPEAIGRFDLRDFDLCLEGSRRALPAGQAQQALAQLDAAINLYTDDLATDDLYDDWVQPLREQLRDRFLVALTQAADLAERLVQPELALRLRRQAFHRDPADETLCVLLIQALAAAGLRTEALQHYVTCERALADLGLAPSDALRRARSALGSTRPLPAPHGAAVPTA
jgi:DNA-binding SARP family transcriptional activator